jgi:hypothetical protein
MGFQQATIPIRNAEAFAKLKSLIETALKPANAPKLLAGVVETGLVVWKVDDILQKSLLEQAAGIATGQAQDWYRQLPVSDQAQIREFYLTHIEQVDGAMRQKYKKAFRYL